MAIDGYQEKRLVAAVAKYREAREARGGDAASRNALIEAEKDLAGELKGRRGYVAEDGVEFRARANGRVRVVEPRPPREPGRRAVRVAERYGYSGTRDELVARGREIRRALRGLTRDDVETLLSHVKERDQADLDALMSDDDVPPGSPSPTPTPRAASPAAPRQGTGWTADGRFVASNSQLRDPAFCFANQADITKASKNNSLVLID
jgi:hypothetical protein